MLDNLTELPFKEAGQRVISKGYLNLQNRHDLLEVEDVTPGEWMEFDFDLQPTIYKLEKGATLRLVLYTTDFEITVRPPLRERRQDIIPLVQNFMEHFCRRYNQLPFDRGVRCL